MSAYSAETIKAIEAVAAERSKNFIIKVNGDTIQVVTFCADTGASDIQSSSNMDMSVEVHRLKTGRWLRAVWKDMHAQWQSSDFTPSFMRLNRQAVFSVAKTVDLLGLEIQTYSSPAAAIRAAYPTS